MSIGQGDPARRAARAKALDDTRAELAKTFTRAETLADALINLRANPSEMGEAAVLLRDFTTSLRQMTGIVREPVWPDCSVCGHPQDRHKGACLAWLHDINEECPCSWFNGNSPLAKGGQK